MQKWEYLIVDGNDAFNQGKLNELGAQGWEICGFHGVTLYLKRPIE